MDDRSTRVALSGGVSCEVAVVRDESGREIVIKQPLPKLRVMADWRSDPRRASVEVAALRAMRELLGSDSVPEVLWEDAVNHRFAMERIDASLRNWRDELNRRHVDLRTATRVGELLGQLHVRSAQRREVAQRFADREYFRQLRIEPFFERVATKNPALDTVIAETIDALLAPGRALVHGDFSPKNMLVDGAHVVILDAETSHWGEPRFDVAFCLMHLTLDGLHKPPPQPYAAAIRNFLDAYAQVAGSDDLDALLMRITGCLMLARLEGASPIDFLRELDTANVKHLAVEWIERPPRDPYPAISAVLGERADF